jgi:hypothetical protein
VYNIQSTDEPLNVKTTESQNHEEVNVQFFDEQAGETNSVAPVQQVSRSDIAQNLGITDFLSRPVLIKTATWNETDPAGTLFTINPWYEFFNTTPLKRKLDNFGLINCKLHLKLVINASPFYYGAAYLNYRPLSGYSDDLAPVIGADNPLIPLSQRHGIWVYPQTCQGGDLELPFFYHKNTLELTSATKLQNMGSLNFTIYAALQSATGVTGTGVSVQLYAWATDVNLSAPTVALAVQSSDEYAKGPVSSVASAIAKASGYLGNVPVIGKFMTATSVGSTAIAKIAHIFGFTNPPVISDVQPYRPGAFQHFATTEIGVPADKLSLDTKNELTIDASVHNISAEDELNIITFCKRESYLCQPSLSTGNSPNIQIFLARVHPLMHLRNVGTVTAIQTTPMAYLSQLFTYWRGDIIFRFKFICTRYHKGRVRISYDPVGSLNTETDATQTTFTQIIDIGEETDIKIRIPYMQAQSWCKTLDLNRDKLWEPSSVATLTHTDGVDNGLIRMQVVTPITAPVASSNVPIIVSVYAADNFEVAKPRDNNASITTLPLQSQDEVCAGETQGDSHLLNLVTMGEAVTSLRPLLHRTVYNHAIQWSTDTTSALSMIRNFHSKYPLTYGYADDGVNSAVATIGTGNKSFNYSTNTPFNWLAPCFVATRGSVVWNFNVDSNISAPLCDLNVQRWEYGCSSADFIQFKQFTGVNNGSLNKFLRDNTNQGIGGMALTNQETQAGLTVLYPNYNNYNFTIINQQTLTNGSAEDGSNQEKFYFSAIAHPLSGEGLKRPVDSIQIHKYFSCGPDFNFLYFLSTPITYVLASPAVP